MNEAQDRCLNCTKPFITPAQVKGYKRFCSDKCRSEWHSKIRKKALELMRAGNDGDARGNDGEEI